MKHYHHFLAKNLRCADLSPHHEWLWILYSLMLWDIRWLSLKIIFYMYIIVYTGKYSTRYAWRTSTCCIQHALCMFPPFLLLEQLQAAFLPGPSVSPMMGQKRIRTATKLMVVGRMWCKTSVDHITMQRASVGDAPHALLPVLRCLKTLLQRSDHKTSRDHGWTRWLPHYCWESSISVLFPHLESLRSRTTTWCQ